MEKVTDEELLKKLNEPIKQSFNKVTDENLLKKLNKDEDGFIVSKARSIYDFFSGTKRTEYQDLPEIGSYKGKGAAKIALGLNLTPDQKVQAQIIKKQVPGTSIINDKFGNTIAKFPDGQAFYLNKPGASFQDFVQTTSQILQYIPGQSMALKAAGGSLLKRGVYSGVAGGGTSVAQDLATVPLGSKEGIDPVKGAISTVIPATFETVINPAGRVILRKLFGNPKFVTSDGTLNAKGKKAAKAAGLDVDSLDKDFIKKFGDELSKGVRTDIASAEAAAGRFGFSLSRSQALGDEEGFARLIAASKGSYGRDAQEISRNFLKQQNLDIEKSAENLVRSFNRGQFETIDDAGEQIIKGIYSQAKKQDEKVATLYNTIDKDAIFNAQESNIAVLPQNIRGSISANGADIIDAKLTPNTVRALQDVRSFVTKIKGTKKRKPQTTDLNDFENFRKKLNNYKVNAFKTGQDMDYKNLSAVVDEFDDFYDDALDNLLFSGDENALRIIKNARAENRIKNERFGVRKRKHRGMKIDDRAGKVVVKILSDPDVSPTEAINYIFGKSSLGAKDGSREIIKRLKEIFGIEGNLTQAAKNSADFQALRTAAFQKIIRDSVKQGRFSPETMSRLWDNATKDKKLLLELFEENEIKLIDQFVKEVRKTFKPRDLVNFSNTASAIERTIQQVGRGLAGVFGFKAANIQGLLLARGFFDRARDLSDQKLAKKLVEQEFMRITPRTGTPFVPAIETGATVQNLYGNNVIAPQAPGLLGN